MALSVRALRGATTADTDTPEQIAERMQELLRELFERNQVAHDDLISIVFTATGDLVSVFPAAAARAMGLGDVPLLCARELDIVGSTPRCLRVLVHLTTDIARADLHHVYLHGARTLRDDLPE
jgi:chorismate mutase